VPSLTEKLAASEARLRQEAIEIIDDCDHSVFKWSYCFRRHVAGRFGTAVIQVCLVYGQYRIPMSVNRSASVKVRSFRVKIAGFTGNGN
jgi:hypothetical protein